MEIKDMKDFWYILLAGIFVGILCCLLVISIYKLNHISLTKIYDENNSTIYYEYQNKKYKFNNEILEYKEIN